MLIVGIAFLVFWLLVQVLAFEIVKAALITAIIFIVAGIFVEGLPNDLKFTRKP